MQHCHGRRLLAPFLEATPVALEGRQVGEWAGSVVVGLDELDEGHLVVEAPDAVAQVRRPCSEGWRLVEVDGFGFACRG